MEVNKIILLAELLQALFSTHVNR